MNSKIRHIHMVGIGGAGMAPLAAILLEHGAAVSGSDREANAKTAELARHGAVVQKLDPDLGVLLLVFGGLGK